MGKFINNFSQPAIIRVENSYCYTVNKYYRRCTIRVSTQKTNF